MADVELFNTKISPFGHRVRIMLAEKGIDYALIAVDLANRTDEFYAVSPYGKVPALRCGSDRVWESVVICEYLDEAFPTPPMMPRDPGMRALARIWMDFCNTRLMPAFRELIMEQDRVRWPTLLATVTGHLEFIEQRGLVDAAPYWMGQAAGVVDVVYWPWFERFGLHSHYRGLEFPSHCLRLNQWIDAMRARPAVQAASKPLDYYIKGYARFAGPGAATNR